MKYTVSVRYARYEGGRYVEYPPGSVVELTDGEVAQFSPGVVRPVTATVEKTEQVVFRTTLAPATPPPLPEKH